MAGRPFIVSILAVLALSLALLSFPAQKTSAITYKMHYDSILSCNGADGVAGTRDDTCDGDNVPTETDAAYTPGAHSGGTSILTIDASVDGTVHKHSQYGKIATFNNAPAWSVVKGSDITDGAYAGILTTTATLSILNGPCSSPIPVRLPLLDATTDLNNGVDWLGDGDNLLADPDGNGLPAYVDKFPTYLANATDPDRGIVPAVIPAQWPGGYMSTIKPWARYAGHTFVVAGAPASKLEFLLYAPGALSLFLPPQAENDMGDTLGWINYVVLDNPWFPPAPSSITEFCEPLQTFTTLYGQTEGKGQLGPGNYGPELWFPCTDSKDDDLGATAIAETNPAQCNDNLDNDHDGYLDDGCPRVTTYDDCDANHDGDCTDYGEPALCFNTVDDDSDGVKNDGCPARGDGYVNDGCKQIGNTGESGAAQCQEAPGSAIDDDLDGYVNDGCPKVGAYGERGGCLEDPSGPLCFVTRNSNPAAGTGIYGTDTHLVGTYGQSYRDADLDGISNSEDGCPFTVDSCVDTLDNDSDTSASPNDGCPRVGAPENPQCAETTTECGDDPASCDSDGDSPIRINDGCPKSGQYADCDADHNGSCSAGEITSYCNESTCVGPAYCDDDEDGFVNDGCPAVSASEDEGECLTDTTDDDGDGYLNDGCPRVGTVSEGDDDGAQDLVGDGLDYVCDPHPDVINNNEDDDPAHDLPDPYDNRQDNCPLVANEFQENTDAVPAADGGPGDDIGDACDPNPLTAETEGVFLKDLVRTPICLGTDSDGDTWCDATECVENPTWPTCSSGLGSDPNDADSTPENIVLDPSIDPAPGTCSNRVWYATSGDPAGAGDEVDDDLDSNTNAADTGCTCPGSDADCDGVPDSTDNCTNVYNPDQLNTDGSVTEPLVARGDACDKDDDNDGWLDVMEIMYGGQPKNATRYDYASFGYDVTGDTKILSDDIQAFKGRTGTLVPQGGTKP